ncbi:MAG: Gfo/Idh/MocA family oxidoreductase, partial [Acidobacteriota bacterium]|nr:Gfo/Idh/MocA family oxidoreductase [Acidobacteriota bacterium]
MSGELNRRDFMRRAAAGAAGVGAALSSVPRNVVGANDRVIAAGIGTGRQGTYDLTDFARQPDVEIAAVCDVYEPNAQKCLARLGHSGAQTYKDYRQLLDRKDIDVVVVGTPDHWHPLVAVDACRAGKDVYVEKPLSHTIDEGIVMVEAARRYKRVVQVGTQQRSGKHFQEAARLIQQGYIGKVSFVRTWNYSNQFPDGIGNPPDSDPPPGLDWNFWQGPAPAHPFNPNRFGVYPNTWSTFRYFWDYAGGVMTDWGVHLMDIVQMAMQVEGPEVITALGGRFYIDDNATTPDTLQVTYQYPHFIAVYENRWSNANSMENHGYGMEFHGTDGTLFIDRGGFEVFPEKRELGGKSVTVGAAMKMERVNDAHFDHVRNFLDCVKSRARPVSDVEIGHRSTSVCLLGNVAYRSKQRIVWNVENQEIIEGGAEARRLVTRDYR